MKIECYGDSALTVIIVAIAAACAAVFSTMAASSGYAKGECYKTQRAAIAASQPAGKCE